ncbi:partial, partial [Paramuricea clavata]
TACGGSCHANAQCELDGLTYRCRCQIGYAGNGTYCEDINECTVGTHNCHENATCTDNVGSFSCQCNAGYSGNGVACSSEFS